MKKKLMLLFLTISILMMVLVGCSNNSNNIQKNSTNKEKITVATSGTYYPFTFLEGGELKGFEVDVWNEIGKRLGYDVEFKTASFSGLFGMLESGKVNTIANQITVTPEREEKYYFSEPYVYSGAQIIVKKGNDSIKSFDDLKGKKVGVDLGSNYEKIVKDKDENNEIKILTYQNTDAAFNELLLGRIDAVVIDRVSAIAAIKEKDLNLQLAGEPIDKIENAYPFVKDEKGKDLSENVNKALDEMKKDGVIIAQSPSGDSKVSKGTTIDLVVNKAKAKKVKVPNLVGMTLKDARDTLSNIQLGVNQVSGSVEEKSVVIEQSIKAGDEIDEGSTLNLTTEFKDDKKKSDKKEGNSGNKTTGTIDVTVPAGSKNQELKIVVKDDEGSAVIYDDTNKPGDRVVKKVSGVGNVRIEVYLNGALVQETAL